MAFNRFYTKLCFLIVILLTNDVHRHHVHVNASARLGQGVKLTSDLDDPLSNATDPHLGNLFLRANLVPNYLEAFLESSGNIFPNNSDLSESCRNDFNGWFTEIRTHYDQLILAESWALQMMDSWGKAPEGLLSGHINSLGDFDECVKVRGALSSGSKFKGKYCTNQLVFSESKTLNNRISGLGEARQDYRTITQLLGLLEVLSKTEPRISASVASCLPSTCSQQDVQLIVQLIFQSSEVTRNFVNPVTINCSTDDKPPLTGSSIAMIIIILILLLLLAAGTMLDALGRYGYGNSQAAQQNWKENLRKVLLAFSIAKNTEKLLNTKRVSGDMGCLHGIRFISATWVILGHTFYMHILQPVWNLVDIVQTTEEDLLALLIINGGVVVDTFLTVSGLLVAFTVLKTLDRSDGKLNVPLLFLSRYLRLTPIYAFLIGLSATLFPYVSSGPKWFVVETWGIFCQNNWWKNLLYINNLPIYNDTAPDSLDRLCYGESWYLGADMQLFLISPFFIYPLWRWQKVGQIILGISTLISIIIPITVTYVTNLLPTSLPFRPVGDFTHQSYMATWMRASPYLMGLWTGYLLYKTERAFVKIPKAVVIGCWFVAGSSALAILLGIQKYYNWRSELPRLEGAIYAGCQHSVWGICMGWTIFACVRGYGGWVNRFLSWKLFVPLGRLTYSIYLVSFHLQFLLHYSYKEAIYYSAYNAVNISFSHLVMSCIAAFILSVAMEAPFMELEKMIIRRKPETEVKERLNGAEFQRDYGTSTRDGDA